MGGAGGEGEGEGCSRDIDILNKAGTNIIFDTRYIWYTIHAGLLLRWREAA